MPMISTNTFLPYTMILGTHESKKAMTISSILKNVGTYRVFWTFKKIGQPKPM